MKSKKIVAAVIRGMFAAGLLASALPAAQAQGVWRCGNSYSQQPCPGGTSVQDAPTPDAASQAASRKETVREAKAADAMEKARLKEEAKPASVYIPPAKSQDVAKAAEQMPGLTKSKKLDSFTAYAPGPKKDKPKPKSKKAKKNPAG